MIVDYKRNAMLAEKNFFDNKDISNKNKKDMKRFLEIYDVSDARKAIFFKHITFLLKETDDLDRDKDNPDIINKIFNKFRTKLSSSYYDTITNVSNRLATWLNDGVKPRGFKDIKGIPKKKRKRNVSRKDMVEWGEFCLLADKAKSIQWKAIPKTQGDAGLRPSEFHDLNYGDAKRKGKFIVLHIRKGKTGERDVTLYKAVPALLRWLDNHPTKKADDPLWVMEYPKKSKQQGIVRYSYPAMRKRVQELAKACKIKKPMDFYNLRHSACFIAKKENMPIDLAAQKFGHGTDYFVNVYGRLDVDDVVDRHKLHYGEEKEKKDEKVELIECPVCSFVNEKRDECEKCHSPLTLSKALEEKQNMANDVLKLMGLTKEDLIKLRKLKLNT